MGNDIYATLRGTRPQLIIFDYILDNTCNYDFNIQQTS